MAWEAVGKERIADIYSVKNGQLREWSAQLPLEKTETDTRGNTLSISIPEDATVIVVPHTLENLEYAVNVLDRRRIVDRLLVGILDSQKIHYIGMATAQGSTEQYFFKDNQPDGYHLNSSSLGQWPTNRRVVIDRKLRPCFSGLKDLRPEARESLDLCVRQLQTAGPDYRG